MALPPFNWTKVMEFTTGDVIIMLSADCLGQESCENDGEQLVRHSPNCAIMKQLRASSSSTVRPAYLGSSVRPVLGRQETRAPLIRDPFCGCPYNKSPTIGVYVKDPEFWKLQSVQATARNQHHQEH